MGACFGTGPEQELCALFVEEQEGRDREEGVGFKSTSFSSVIVGDFLLPLLVTKGCWCPVECGHRHLANIVNGKVLKLFM